MNANVSQLSMKNITRKLKLLRKSMLKLKKKYLTKFRNTKSLCNGSHFTISFKMKRFA